MPLHHMVKTPTHSFLSIVRFQFPLHLYKSDASPHLSEHVEHGHCYCFFQISLLPYSILASSSTFSRYISVLEKHQTCSHPFKSFLGSRPLKEKLSNPCMTTFVLPEIQGHLKESSVGEIIQAVTGGLLQEEQYTALYDIVTEKRKICFQRISKNRYGSLFIGQNHSS